MTGCTCGTAYERMTDEPKCDYCVNGGAVVTEFKDEIDEAWDLVIGSLEAAGEAEVSEALQAIRAFAEKDGRCSAKAVRENLEKAVDALQHELAYMDYVEKVYTEEERSGVDSAPARGPDYDSRWEEGR